jgi:hypothetical protein
LPAAFDGSIGHRQEYRSMTAAASASWSRVNSVVRGKARDAEDGDAAEDLPVGAVAVPLDEEDLPHLRPPLEDLPRRRQGLDGAGVNAAVAAVHGPGLSREGPPGQHVRRIEQFLLVIADGEEEERVRVVDVLRVPALGMHLVRRYDRALEVAGRDLLQQVAEDRDLISSCRVLVYAASVAAAFCDQAVRSPWRGIKIMP